MPAYYGSTIAEFLQFTSNEITGQLQRAYASDGFATQYTRQTQAWLEVVKHLQQMFRSVVQIRPSSAEWGVLLEYPLYRLRRRIDIVFLVGNLIVVVECKVGAFDFTSHDIRQVEEYALDLRDFHAGSHCKAIIPVLWSTNAVAEVHEGLASPDFFSIKKVHSVLRLGNEGLAHFFQKIDVTVGMESLIPAEWDRSPYRPIPSVIQAATSIFSGHSVDNILKQDADNLKAAAARLLELIVQAKKSRGRYLLILTGVPGSGKTLAGLTVVHNAIATGKESEGDIVYLSGNTPLVSVLREALARDENSRNNRDGVCDTLGAIRDRVRTRIQHINDYLKTYVTSTEIQAPHEHVIIFDEAQRAWDKDHGQEKFQREASEPSLVLQMMTKHPDWCACVCLIGSGQEINSGEDGVLGWGEALRAMEASDSQSWEVFGPNSIFSASEKEITSSLGNLPKSIFVHVESKLQLTVPQRSYRSPCLSQWIDRVLMGDSAGAASILSELDRYPLRLTRTLSEARDWLRQKGRGERRYGLLACSSARRLRADGIGVTLKASDGDSIAQWYLEPHGDIRSSYALEVPANEYTSQGLELDFACVCWGGDFLWDNCTNSWTMKKLLGNKWNLVHDENARRFLLNSYRVLLTRSREGLVIWVPQGDECDHTRPPESLDATAEFLIKCGVQPLVDLVAERT